MATQPVGLTRVYGFMKDRYVDAHLATQMALFVMREARETSWLELSEKLMIDGGLTQIEVDELFHIVFQGGRL